MKSTLIKTTFYALVLLTPLVTQASNEGREHRHIHDDESSRAQNSYHRPDDVLPVASVPEPGALALLGAGFIGLIAARRAKS